MFDSEYHYNNFSEALKQLKKNKTKENFIELMRAWSSIDTINELCGELMDEFDTVVESLSEDIRGIKELEGKVEIYRATTVDGKYGYSWTPCYKVASFFKGYRKSYRIMESREVKIYKTTACKNEVLCINDTRGEKEYIMKAFDVDKEIYEVK